MTTLTPPPSPLPVRTMNQTDFDAAMALLVAWLPTNNTELIAFQAALASISAGTAMAIPYTFSTTTTDADPGNGFLRLDNATQSSAVTIRADLLGSDTTTYTGVLDTFTQSTSAVKGQIRLVKLADSTKWICFNITAVASPSGYRNITVVEVAASSSNPFSNNDPLILLFTRTGDIGTAGTLVRRVSTITSSATPTPNAATDDMFTITALAAAPTFAAPTGSPSDGQSLMYRIKDNATPRALAWNAIYRASTDLALPTTTVASKTLYVGFIYNGVDSKWDLIAVLNNF
jgi:hypothetical protein